MRLFLRAMILIAMGWIGYANIRLLGSAADMIRQVNAQLGVKIQMYQIAQMIRREYVGTDVIVTDYLPLLRLTLAADGRKVTPKTGLDHWGRVYVVQVTKAGFRITSAGPDRRFGSADDLVFEQSMRDLR